MALVFCNSCSDNGATPPEPARRVPQITEDKILGGLDLQVEADTVIRGDRPRLYVSCSGTPILSFDVVVPPSTIPPLAGVQSQIEVEREAWSAEWSIADPKSSLWTLRDPKLSAQLARAVIDATEVRVRPPAAFAPAEAIIWKVDLTPRERKKMATQCK